MTTLQRIGAGIVVVSIVTGVCGLLWSIYPAFVAKDDADYVAIPSAWVDNAIWFAIAAVAGGAMGTAFMVVGRRHEKEDRKPRTRS